IGQFDSNSIGDRWLMSCAIRLGTVRAKASVQGSQWVARREGILYIHPLLQRTWTDPQGIVQTQISYPCQPCGEGLGRGIVRPVWQRTGRERPYMTECCARPACGATLPCPRDDGASRNA